MKPSKPVTGNGRYAVDWAERENAVDELVLELDRRATQRRRRRLGTVVVATAVLVLVGVFLRPAWNETPAITATPPSAIVTTPPRQLLPDGSIVELKEDAAIAVDFTSDRRQVRLQRGVAHFKVAKNPQIPFIVQVGRIEVRAVGTEFSVNFNETSAEVLVTEGSVAVEKPTDASGATAIATEMAKPQMLAVLEMGKKVVIDIASPTITSAPVQIVGEAEIAELLAWRVPRLEFTATPLAEAVAMFNRYNQVQLTLENAALGELKVSGFLRADKTETFLRLLESDFGLAADRRSPTQIILRRPR
jgi:transmembrane sensor